MQSDVKYSIDFNGDRVQIINTDIELPFVYFELMVKISIRLGINYNELILLALDRSFEESPIIKEFNKLS